MTKRDVRQTADDPRVTELIEAGLEPRKARVMAHLLLGATATRAAEAEGVSRRTVFRWLKEDPIFQAEYNRRRAELAQATDSTLAMLAESSTFCVAQALYNGDARVALAVLKGLGYLNGRRAPLGEDDPQRLLAQRERNDRLAALRAELNC